MSLPRYPQYKPSGVEWLSEVPSHWDAARLKTIVSSIESGVSVNALDTPADDGAIGVLKTSCVYDGTFRANENKLVLEEEIGRARCPVREGALVVSRMNTPDLVGAAGLVDRDLPNIFLPDRLWQVSFRNCLPKFVHKWTQSRMYRTQVEVACSGTSSSMQNLGQDQFGSFLIPMPPPQEQHAVATFLDRETSKIDALVAEQERLIALLKEKRQAVISHAVTKGLDPDAPMKPSGIEWLGDVPAHWRMVPLKHLVSFQSGGTPNKKNTEYWDGDIPWASAKDMKKETLFETEDHITLRAIHDHAANYIPENSVVVVVRGMILARTFPVTVLGVPMAINQDLKALLPTEAIKATFLAWYLRGTEDESLTKTDEAGHGTKTLRMDRWGSLEIALPSTLDQGRIVDFLTTETSKLDSLVAEVETTIRLLGERRAALISAAVTGQIDVRNAA